MSVFKWVKGLFRKEQPVNDSVKWDIVDGHMPGTFMVRRTQYGVCQYLWNSHGLHTCSFWEHEPNRIMKYCIFDSHDKAQIAITQYVRVMEEKKEEWKITEEHIQHIIDSGPLDTVNR